MCWVEGAGVQQLCPLVLDDGKEKRPFAREVVIRRPAGDLGGICDLVDRHLLVEPAGEQLGADRQQLRAPLLGALPCTP
jgi:hypothetical protein